MEPIICALLLSAAEDSAFPTSSSPWYLTTSVFFEEAQLKNSGNAQALDFNDEAAFSFGIGTMASDSLIVEAHYQANELSESNGDDIRDFEYDQLGLTLGYEVEVNDKVSLTPRVGFAYTNWDVDIDDGVFGTISADDSDWTWKYGFNVEYKVDNMTLYAGYMFQQGEFGPVEFDSDGLLFGASLSF